MRVALIICMYAQIVPVLIVPGQHLRHLFPEIPVHLQLTLQTLAALTPLQQRVLLIITTPAVVMPGQTLYIIYRLRQAVL